MLVSVLLSALVAGCSSPRQAAIPAPVASEQCRFLAVGRQGYGNRSTGRIAASMERIAAERGDVNLALLLGDNFYPRGVRSTRDSQWDRKFEQLYAGSHLGGMPFYAILGNHDHQGSVEAQLDYSKRRLGSGRWRMEAPFYCKDFGTVGAVPLVRIAFLDSVSLIGKGTIRDLRAAEVTRDQQIEFLRRCFPREGVQPRWKIVASHYPAKSHTKLAYSSQRVMGDLQPLLEELGVDLFISSNDRFQQIHSLAGETMHVSTGGGGRKTEEISPLDTPTDFVLARRGFALVTIDRASLSVELFNADGEHSHKRTREESVRRPAK